MREGVADTHPGCTYVGSGYAGDIELGTARLTSSGKDDGLVARMCN